MKLPRSSGVLLHPTSLPGRYGLGSLGIEAYRFVDFLAAAGQSFWQILPLGPTGYGDSPYSAYSAFAGNPLLISLERLAEVGDLEPQDLAGVAWPEGVAHFGFVHAWKGRLLQKAATAFDRQENGERREAFAEFCREQGYWLEDYALFRALHQHFDYVSWNCWPDELRRRDPAALETWRATLAGKVQLERYTQFIFFEQWFVLKSYANQKGVKILGDIPIFVAFDSADVWAHAAEFQLDEAGNPTLVAGVPPDYFSATGQRWGNPLYRWEVMAERGFSWWLDRFRWNLTQTDWVRIDHFRGFESCWAIPATEATAVNGNWQPAPGAQLFQALAAALGTVPVIAEDLGVITPEVEALRDNCGFPGMKILQFGFDSGPTNPYLPHNLTPPCVIYTGTHDNDTTHGWWDGVAPETRETVRTYLGSSGEEIGWDMIRLAASSVANLCIFPLQDLLALGSEARLNCPGKAQGNWGWRVLPGALTRGLESRLARLCQVFGRLP